VVFTTGSALGCRRALAWALVAFVVEYGIALADRPRLDVWAPLVGGGLLLIGELASRAVPLRGQPMPEGPASTHMVEALGYALAAILIGVVVVASAAGQPRGSFLLQGASAAAAVGLFFLIGRMAKGRSSMRS
jgi:hypothetical protein